MMTRLYTLLLRLYPRVFRAEFGAEMQAVFMQAANEQGNSRNILKLFLRELKDFPASLLRQHWAIIQKEFIPLITKREPEVGEWEKRMLRNKFMQIWRKLILLLMLIAICSPWMLEMGDPFPGILLLIIHFFGGFFGSIIWILTAERLLLQGLIMSFGGTWLMLAPPVSMLLLIASKDQPFGGGERAHVRVLSSALAIGVAGIMFGVIELTWQVWGVWLYLLLLASEVAMEVIMIISDSNRGATQTRQPGSWGAVIMASLPYLLMGLLFSLGKFSIFEAYDPSEISSQAISMAVGTSLGIFVIGLLLFAWRRGWPLWSASWYLHGTWVVLAAASLLIDSLNLDESWRYTNVLFLGWIGLCIIGYFLIVSKSRLHGLLSVAFLFPVLGLMFLEFIPNLIEGWLAIGFGMAAAGCAGVIVRRGNFRLSLGLVLSFNIIAGLLLAYVSEYQAKDLPAGIPAHIPEFGTFLSILGLYSLFGLGVVAIPFILRGLWDFGRRRFSS